MKLAEPKCPNCGLGAVGTVEQVPGISYFNRSPCRGSVEYQGDTELCWEGQKTEQLPDGRSQVICKNDHTWYTVIDLELEKILPKG